MIKKEDYFKEYDMRIYFKNITGTFNKKINDLEKEKSLTENKIFSLKAFHIKKINLFFAEKYKLYKRVEEIRIEIKYLENNTEDRYCNKCDRDILLDTCFCIIPIIEYDYDILYDSDYDCCDNYNSRCGRCEKYFHNCYYIHWYKKLKKLNI